MGYKLADIRTWIDEYVKKSPKGNDVTAFVLSRIGRASIESMAKSKKVKIGDINKEVGADVNRLLFEKYPARKELGSVHLDAGAWPELVGWVTSYTTYDIR